MAAQTETAPVILLTGDQPFLQQEWLARLRQRLDIGPFDEQTFRGPEAAIADVLAAAQSTPLAAARRLILLAAAHRLPVAALPHLVTYARHPQSSTCLVLLLGGSVPKGEAWAEMASLAQAIACDAPQGAALHRWLADRATGLGKTLDAAAAALLEEQWGHDLLALANALEQAASYVGSRRAIAERDIEVLGGRNPQATAFQWTDMIVAGDAASALRLLVLQQHEGKTAPELIGLLTWQFGRLLRAKRSQASGAGEPQVLAAAGVKTYWRGEFLRQLRAYTLPRLQAAAAAMLDADLAIKRGRVTPDVGMVLLVTRLCGSLQETTRITA